MSDPTAAAQAARTVFRNKEGKKVSRAELLAERVKEKRIKTPEELEKEHYDWNVATATKISEKERIQQIIDVQRSGYTQYADNEELNKRQREELRPDDPMYEYFLSKRQEEEDAIEKEKEKNNKEKDSKPQVSDISTESKKPKYRGPLPAPNRFGIVPGYRWDGISRGNGFESKRILHMNIEKMRKQQAYQWSVANL